MIKKIYFYITESGKQPVKEFILSLDAKTQKKVTFVINLILESDMVSSHFFKKLKSEDIWEIRIKLGSNIYRLLGFIYKNVLVILTNGFVKKTDKTPKNEIERAKKYKKDFLERKE